MSIDAERSQLESRRHSRDVVAVVRGDRPSLEIIGARARGTLASAERGRDPEALLSAESPTVFPRNTRYARVEPAANRLRDGNPTFFFFFWSDSYEREIARSRGSRRTEMPGKRGARGLRRELIKYYIFESYSAFSRLG